MHYLALLLHHILYVNRRLQVHSKSELSLFHKKYYPKKKKKKISRVNKPHSIYSKNHTTKWLEVCNRGHFIVVRIGRPISLGLSLPAIYWTSYRRTLLNCFSITTRSRGPCFDFSVIIFLLFDWFLRWWGWGRFLSYKLWLLR